MKKQFATFQLSLTALLLAAPVSVALAQTQTLPTLSVVGVPTTTGTLAPATTTTSAGTANTPVTAEPLPQQTMQQMTQQTQVAGGTRSTTSTTGTGGTTIPRTDLAQPDLPILDITQQTESTEQSQQCVNSAPSQCLSPEQAKAAVTPSLTANQIKFALLVFIGGIIGGLSWLFSNFAMNNAVLRRAEMRFDRQTRLRNANRRHDQLHASYNKVTDCIANIMKSQANGKVTFTKDALKSFKEAMVEVEMFGSQNSVNASRRLSDIISSSRVVSAEELNGAKNELITSLKKDLGLKF